MFGNSDGPMTMDALLGKKASDAKLMTSGLLPKGDYVLEFVGFEEETYEIKADEHPNAGDDAAMLKLNYIIRGVDDKGKYLNLKGKRVSAEDMAEFVEKTYSENCMFGNDGLVVEGTGDNRVIRNPENDEDMKKVKNTGFDKVTTLLARHIGEKAWGENGCDDKSLGELLQFATGRLCITPITHNTWNDRTSLQINIMDDFEPLD